MYDWREMTPEERTTALERRQARRRPWHRPPHEGGAENSYHLSAACYEHRPFIGMSPDRIELFEEILLKVIEPVAKKIFAWSVLPNHYHLLLRAEDVRDVITAIGKFHGHTAFTWNQDDHSPGRKVWHGCAERRIRSERHFWATMNYVHHNPVRHGYVQRWQDWPYSSAKDFLNNLRADEAGRIWKEFPLMDYGKGWDDPEL